MNKKVYSFLFTFLLVIFTIGLLNASIVSKENTDLYFSITSNFADNCTLTTIDTPNETTTINQVATKISQTFLFNITESNFSQIGSYKLNIECTDGSTIVTQYEDLEITPNGETLNIQTAMIQIILILFFLFLGVGFYFLSQRIDLEKMNKSIMKKYENKNYIKLVLSSISYNIMKNPFVIYYLIGLPIIITLVDLSYAYGLDNLVSILRALLIFYFVGVIIVGLIFFSYVQEWLMDLLEKVSDMNWGVGK